MDKEKISHVIFAHHTILKSKVDYIVRSNMHHLSDEFHITYDQIKQAKENNMKNITLHYCQLRREFLKLLLEIFL